MGHESLKYNIGDLVINLFPLELAFDQFVIREGSVGLVVGFVSEKIHNISGYHYNILICGREVAFFEQELTIYKKGDY